MADVRSGSAWFVEAADGEGLVEVAGNDTAVAVVVAVAVAVVVSLAFEADCHVGVDVGN